jgi:hypothetical protein
MGDGVLLYFGYPEAHEDETWADRQKLTPQQQKEAPAAGRRCHLSPVDFRGYEILSSTPPDGQFATAETGRVGRRTRPGIHWMAVTNTTLT